MASARNCALASASPTSSCARPRARSQLLWCSPLPSGVPCSEVTARRCFLHRPGMMPGRPPRARAQMKSPAWGRGAVPLGATEGLGGGAKVLFETISSDTPAAYYTLVCGVSFSWPSVASKAHRQPFNERREPGREQAVHPSYSGWGFRILDRRTTMRAASRAPQR
jgi:hypothetical protein